MQSTVSEYSVGSTGFACRLVCQLRGFNAMGPGAGLLERAWLRQVRHKSISWHAPELHHQIAHPRPSGFIFTSRQLPLHHVCLSAFDVALGHDSLDHGSDRVNLGLRHTSIFSHSSTGYSVYPVPSSEDLDLCCELLRLF